MKKTAISRLSLLLAILSLCTLLAACNQNTIDPPKVKLENVYTMEELPLPEGITYPEYFLYGGDKVYIVTSAYDEERASYFTSVYSMNPDGTDSQKTFEFAQNNEEILEEGYSKYSYVNGVYVDHEGFLWVCTVDSTSDARDPNEYKYENKSSLSRYDADGNVIDTLDLSQLADTDHFYINNLLFREDGKIIVLSDNVIYFIDKETLTLDFTLTEENYWFDSIFLTADNRVHALRQDYETGSTMLFSIDESKKDWGESIETTISGYNHQGFMKGSGDYLFFYRSNEGIYGYRKDTDTVDEVLNWINCDIDPGNINYLFPYEDGRFICSGYSNDRAETTIGILTQIPADQIKEKVIITLATQYLNYDVRREIINFNKSQDDYRITVKTYEQFSNESNNWQGGVEALNRDIIGGNIPDIIDMSGLSANTYINKGLFTDIYKLMDADDEVSREDYLENILEACSKNGKLYQFMPTFSLHTVAAKTSLVGTEPGWTLDDLNQLLAQYPGSQAFNEMTREALLQTSARMSMSSFIDLETGKCDFNNQGFIDLLEFANSLPAELNWEDMSDEDWNEYWNKYQTQYQENRTLLVEVYAYSLRTVRDTVSTFQEDITFIGFPTADKNGAAINSYQSYAIAEKSPVKEVCWDFLKALAPNELVIDSPWYYGNLTINKNALNQLVEFEMTPYNERPILDSDGVIRPMKESISMRASASSMVATPDIEIEPGYEEDDYYANHHLTQEEIDQVMALITSVNKLSYQDQNVMTIITEEIGPFFDGRKSAAATAEIIQSRVQLYVSENQ